MKITIVEWNESKNDKEKESKASAKRIDEAENS